MTTLVPPARTPLQPVARLTGVKYDKKEGEEIIKLPARPPSVVMTVRPPPSSLHAPRPVSVLVRFWRSAPIRPPRQQGPSASPQLAAPPVSAR